MSFVLLLLGLVTMAIGAALAAWGGSINEFSLGGTLIGAGTTCLVGGLIVIGLSAACRQLGQIVSALNAAPAPRVPLAGDQMPTRPTDAGRSARLRAAEEAASEAAPEPALPEPALDDSGRRPVLPRRARSEPAFSETGVQRSVLPRVDIGRANVAAERVAARSRPETPRSSGRAASTFDKIWPVSRQEARPDKRAETAETESAAEHPTAPRVAPPREETPEREGGAPVSILKSGIVDGMAYTLYTDGSIEAELAQGVVRFGSIEELRNHLEKEG